jgi:predicted HD phosphohydrolase
MKTHEKWLTVVLVAVALATLSAPRWWPAVAPTARKAQVPKPAQPVDEASARVTHEKLPPFEPASFAHHVDTAHYAIASNASPEQTQRVAGVVEALHAAYAQFFGEVLPPRPTGARFQMALYRDRRDFQAHNTSRAWAEGFYRKPVCHAYFDAASPNPVHWMLHEATHQLDTEWARFPRTPWVEEGLASYFGTSRIVDGVLRPGEVDPDTYPLWWLEDLRLSGDHDRDIAYRKLVPLRELIDNDGPPIPADVNRYYIGYWSLAHYLLHGDGGRHADAFRAMVAHGGTLEDFERLVGPGDRVEAGWYAYLVARRDEVRAMRALAASGR